MTPYFFVSYAAGSGRRGVEGFHADLQRAIFAGMGDSPRYEGRLADFPQFGGGRAPVADTPAMSCRAMVALYSDDYFRTPRCRYDWSVFQQRLTWERHRTGQPSMSLTVVAWTDEPPAWVATDEVSVISRSVATDYRRGVRRLVGDPAAHGAYRSVLRGIADAVVTGAGRPPPAMTAADIDYFGTPPVVPPLPWMPEGAYSSSPESAPLSVLSQAERSAPPPPQASPPHSRPTSPARTRPPAPAVAHRSWFSSADDGQRPVFRGPYR